jgi:hypothetical protein
VVSDAGRYHEVVDTLAATEITSGSGEGMVRHCVDTGGREWTEACTLWEPGRRYRMTVDISTYPASFRAIFKRLEGTWSIAEVEGGTRVTLRFGGDTKLGPLGKLAVAAMGRDSVFTAIFDGYERQLAEA